MLMARARPGNMQLMQKAVVSCVLTFEPFPAICIVYERSIADRVWLPPTPT